MSQTLAQIKPEVRTPSRQGRCDMCNDEDLLLISCSPFGAVSYALCADCIALGLDPLDPGLLSRLEHIAAKCEQILSQPWRGMNEQ